MYFDLTLLELITLTESFKCSVTIVLIYYSFIIKIYLIRKAILREKIGRRTSKIRLSKRLDTLMFLSSQLS